MTDLGEKHVGILIDNYFEQSELTEPRDTLEHAGVDVSLISTGADVLHGMHGAEIADDFTPDIMLADVDFEDFDMLVVPGGVINADKLRMNVKAQDWVHFCIDNEIPLAAICHAPWLLVSAGIAEGMRLTSFYTLQDDIRNAHGNWVDAQLVIDGSVITSRTPDDLPVFCSAIIEALDSAHAYEHAL